MTELDLRARRAGAQLRAVAADRVLPAPAGSPVRASRRGPVVALVGSVAVIAVALVVALPGVRVPIIDPAPPAGPGDVDDPVAADGELPVPPVGEALAAYLADGTPVFVSHPEEGEIIVVGAVDGHGIELGSSLVIYCRTSRWFEDPRFGSRYNGWGDYTGGPAPTGLDDHAVEVVADGQRVRLTGETTTQRSRTDVRAEQPQQGRSCVGEVVGEVDGPHVVRHVPPTDPPTPDVDEVPSDRWMWAQVTVGGTTRAPVLCDADGTCPEDGSLVVNPYVARQPREEIATTVTALVRRSDGDIRLVLPARDTTRP